jgi:hypothetical protein
LIESGSVPKDFNEPSELVSELAPPFWLINLLLWIRAFKFKYFDLYFRYFSYDIFII